MTHQIQNRQEERRESLRKLLEEHPGKTYGELLRSFNQSVSYRLQINSLQGLLLKTARREKIANTSYRYYPKSQKK